MKAGIGSIGLTLLGASSVHARRRLDLVQELETSWAGHPAIDLVIRTNDGEIDTSKGETPSLLAQEWLEVGIRPHDSEAFSIEVLTEYEKIFVFPDCARRLFAGFAIQDADEALAYIKRLMSSRIEVEYAGTHAFRWTLQVLTGQEWRDQWTKKLRMYPFWRAKSVRHFRNKVT